MRCSVLLLVVAVWIACTPPPLLAAPLPLITDPLDSSGGWVATGGSNFTTTLDGQAPSAGTEFWGSTYDGAASVGVSRQFTGLLVQPGTYTVTIDTSGNYTNVGYPPVELDRFAVFGLTGITSPRTVVSAPTPAPGTAWTPWQFTYTVAPGSGDVGNPLGFAARFDTPGGRYHTALDNLRVTFEPVPEPVAACVLGLSGVGLLRRRRVVCRGG